MSTNFPTSLDTLTNPGPLDTQSAVSHSTQHSNANDAIEALQAKVGIDGSAETTSHDYKLGEVAGADQAVGKTATQTIQNKTLGTGTSIALGSDAVGDLFYRGVGGALTRLGIGSNGQALLSNGTNPAWNTVFLPSSDEKDAMAGGGALGTPGSANKFTTEEGLADAILDEDNFASNSATKAPSQQSTAQYIADQLAGAGGETIKSNPDGTWFTFTVPVPELDAGSGDRGWTITNEENLFMFGGYAQIVDTGGNTATATFQIPGAFGGDNSYAGDNEIKIKWYVRASDTSSNIGFGISNVSGLLPGASDAGVYFELDGGGVDYNATTHNGSSATETAISTITYTNWTEYVIHYRPGIDASFYVNGTLVATNTTTLPTGALNYCNLFVESAALSLADITISLKSS